LWRLFAPSPKIMPGAIMDRLDKKIIACLVEDGRMSNNEIARILEISEGTVRNRIRRLSECGALKISGMTAPDSLPDRELVLIGVKVAVSRDLTDIAEKISLLPEVQAASIITGRYDIMVEALLKVKSGPIDFLYGSLSKIQGIIATETFMIMKSFNKWIIPHDDFAADKTSKERPATGEKTTA
jgi:Lrp/AsnC family transcriptional regulator for asnA, asnC and gidA